MIPSLRRISALMILVGHGSAGFAILLMGMLPPALLCGQTRQPPNVLVILADDLAMDAVHAMGGDEVHTPNIDRLVRRGTHFTQAYNQGGWNGAVCVASRAMLMTGRYLWFAHAAEVDFEDHYVAQQRFWPQRLAAAGYHTYFTGKWHVRADATRVFQTTRHVRPGMPPDGGHDYHRPIEGETDSWDPTDPVFGGFWQGGRHWSEVVADDVEFFLTDRQRGDKPFFIYCAFNAPHDPRQSPATFLDLYPLEKVRVPKNFLPEYPFNAAMDAGRSLRDEQLAPFPRTAYAARVHRREYYAIVSHLDAQVGRILSVLQEQGLQENTVVFFTSDHGLACGHHGLWGKQNMFDHSVRVPFAVAGPGIPVGATVSSPIYLQDMVPTTLSLAGLDVPQDVQFHSLLPLLATDHQPPYTAIYGAYLNDAQRMICSGPWKMILYPRAGEVLLFHRVNDPHEMRNLASHPEQRPRLEQLYAELVALQSEVGDRLRLDRSYPQFASIGD